MAAADLHPLLGCEATEAGRSNAGRMNMDQGGRKRITETREVGYSVYRQAQERKWIYRLVARSACAAFIVKQSVALAPNVAAKPEMAGRSRHLLSWLPSSSLSFVPGEG